MSCTNLSNLGVGGNDIIKNIANNERGLDSTRDIGKSRGNLYLSTPCTSLSNIVVDDNDVIKDIDNHGRELLDVGDVGKLHVNHVNRFRA